MKNLLMIFFYSSFLYGVELKVGDLLLQSLNCYACKAIETEEDSNYSHIGIVISINPILVAEAFETVRLVSFKELSSKSTKGSELLVLRHINQELSGKSIKKVLIPLLGKKYDSQFKWGSEEIYCSELIYLIFNALGVSQPSLKNMDFTKNYDFWLKYFNGNIPQEEKGNSPEDYILSSLFMEKYLLNIY